MKRADVFMLGMTGFAAANCISYFIYSAEPFVTGWGGVPGGRGIFEKIGFPFVGFCVSFGGVVPFNYWLWINWLGNLIVAVAVSYLLSMQLENRLPPLWPDQSRSFRYSLRGLLGTMTVICALLGIGMMSPGWGLLMRNSVCFGGPVCVYAWWMYRRQLSWTRITGAAVAMTLLTLAIDLRYQTPAIDGGAIVRSMLPLDQPQWGAGLAEYQEYTTLSFTRDWFTITVVRVVVAVFGLFSLLTIAPLAYAVIWRYYTTRLRRPRSPPAESEPEPPAPRA